MSIETIATQTLAADARALTDRIKVTIEGSWQLIEQAYVTRAWAVLGYRSWDEYCQREFGNSRLRLPREERHEVITSLREIGLSTRAIGSAIGVDQKTVVNDLKNSGEEFSSPEKSITEQDSVLELPPAHRPTVTGIDGKTYAAQRSPGEQPKPKRRPLPAALTEATRDLLRDAEKLARLTQDDRFAQNRKETHHQLPDLLAALEHTVELVRAINPADADTSQEARRWWATSLHSLGDTLTGIANSIEQEK